MPIFSTKTLIGMIALAGTAGLAELPLPPFEFNLPFPWAGTIVSIEATTLALMGLAVVMAGAFVGVLLNGAVSGREMRTAKREIEALQAARDNAVTARTQAINERERALRELIGRQQEVGARDSQVAAMQRQISQAQSYIKTYDQQMEDNLMLARGARSQLDEMRAKLFSAERAASERQISVLELSAQLADAQRNADERGNTLNTISNLMTEHRMRSIDSSSVLDMQRLFNAISHQFEIHRRRLAETQLRQTDSWQMPNVLIASPDSYSTVQTSVHSTRHYEGAKG